MRLLYVTFELNKMAEPVFWMIVISHQIYITWITWWWIWSASRLVLPWGEVTDFPQQKRKHVEYHDVLTAAGSCRYRQVLASGAAPPTFCVFLRKKGRFRFTQTGPTGRVTAWQSSVGGRTLEKALFSDYNTLWSSVYDGHHLLVTDKRWKPDRNVQ